METDNPSHDDGLSVPDPYPAASVIRDDWGLLVPPPIWTEAADVEIGWSTSDDGDWDA